MERRPITKEQMTRHSLDDEFVFRRKVATINKKKQEDKVKPVPMKRKSKSWPGETFTSDQQVSVEIPPIGATWLKAMRKTGYTNITANSKKYKQLLKHTVYNRHTAEACEEMFDLDYGFGLEDRVTKEKCDQSPPRSSD
jgi:hypothetical protein